MYFKIVENHYIKAFGVGNSGTEITESEYNEIKSAIASKPAKTGDTDYKLKDDLTWEAYEVPLTPEPEPEPEEILSILLGGDAE